MDIYIITLTILGVIILLTAWLPMVLRSLPLSLPILCLAFGALLAWSPFPLLPRFNPLENHEFTERMTELVVVVALLGAGLKIDRPFSRRGWGQTLRLLAVAMPLTIILIAFLGHWLLGLTLASAQLFGAALAPTDPVLASDVQVGPPQTGNEDDVRFALTSEAGLNDGLAFPFVYLAIALAANADSVWEHWVAVDVVWRLLAGTAMGSGAGLLFGFLAFRLQKKSLARTKDGFVALGMTFVTYGLTEIVHGYGFVAVFVAALAFRDTERENDFHSQLHDFSEQIERLLMMVLLVCLGAIFVGTNVLWSLDRWSVLAALVILLVIRPVAACISLVGCPYPWREKIVIGVFGIRGLGSIYYLAFASGAAQFGQIDIVWSTTLLVILISIVAHGILVTPTMRWLDGRRSRAEAIPSRGAA